MWHHWFCSISETGCFIPLTKVVSHLRPSGAMETLHSPLRGPFSMKNSLHWLLFPLAISTVDTTALSCRQSQWRGPAASKSCSEMGLTAEVQEDPGSLVGHHLPPQSGLPRLHHQLEGWWIRGDVDDTSWCLPCDLLELSCCGHTHSSPTLTSNAFGVPGFEAKHRSTNHTIASHKVLLQPRCIVFAKGNLKLEKNLQFVIFGSAGGLNISPLMGSRKC